MAIFMKTTVEIEDRLLRRAKRLAAERGCTLRELIEAGLHWEVTRSPRLSARTLLKPQASGPWPAAVDFSSRRAMWEWLDSQPRP
jgi:hypothetical protein